MLPCAEAPTVWSNKEKTLALLIHVDDIAMTGTEEELDKLTTFLKTKYKVAIEEGSKLSFLKRDIEVDETSTNIYVNEKYVDGLVSLFEGVRKRKTPGEMVINEEPLVDPMEVQKYRTGVGTLLYVSSDRPDVQYYVHEGACR